VPRSSILPAGASQLRDLDATLTTNAHQAPPKYRTAASWRHFDPEAAGLTSEIHLPKEQLSCLPCIQKGISCQVITEDSHVSAVCSGCSDRLNPFRDADTYECDVEELQPWRDAERRRLAMLRARKSRSRRANEKATQSSGV